MSVQTIRPLQDSDLPAAAELHRACFPDDAWSGASLRDLLAAPGIAGWIAASPDCAGGSRGFLLARLAADEAEILTLCVAPDQRRRGTGYRLLEAAIRSLAALGAKRLFLEVAVAADYADFLTVPAYETMP